MQQRLVHQRSLHPVLCESTSPAIWLSVAQLCIRHLITCLDKENVMSTVAVSCADSAWPHTSPVCLGVDKAPIALTRANVLLIWPLLNYFSVLVEITFSPCDHIPFTSWMYIDCYRGKKVIVKKKHSFWWTTEHSACFVHMWRGVNVGGVIMWVWTLSSHHQLC